MAKPETTFTTSVHNHLPPGRRAPYWMKNNNLYTSGIWDVWYSGAARDLWVEYKFTTMPKRADTLVDVTLSPLQVDWGMDRHEEGRDLAVIVGFKEGGIILLHREWEEPITQAEAIARLMSRKEIAQWIIDVTNEG